MARVSLCGMSPASSTASPTTFMMRPSVPSPTGTAIGWPLSVTSWPRTRPSLESIATERTVDSPRCWATSSTSRRPWLVVSMALRIAGRWPSKCTSTTGPMTWVIRPTLLSMGRPRKLQRLGAGDDLDQLLGDHRLAGAVVGERLAADHVAGIAGGIVHRRHLRAVERGGVLQERAEDLHRDIARQQRVQDVLGLGLELVSRATERRAGIAVEQWRNDLLRGRDLGDHRAEAREEQGADVELEVIESRNDLVGDALGMLEAQRAGAAQIDQLDDLLGKLPAQLVITLAADAEELDLLAISRKRGGALAGGAHDRGIERAAQAALGGADQKHMDVVAAAAPQKPRCGLQAADAGGDVAQNLLHAGRIGPRRFGRRLGAAQLRRRDHLHGLGDLLRRLGGGDPVAKVFE